MKSIRAIYVADSDPDEVSKTYITQGEHIIYNRASMSRITRVKKSRKCAEQDVTEAMVPIKRISEGSKF